MPQRRRCSRVRTLVVLARGAMPTRSCCSTTRHEMPRCPSSIAAASPAGPAPTIRTSYINITYLVQNSEAQQPERVAAADALFVLGGKAGDAVHRGERVVEAHVEAVIAAERHPVGADQAH